MRQKSYAAVKRLLERERTAREICAELNNFVDLESVLQIILRGIKSLTACEAIAIRLHMDGDYPYYVWDGFTDSFIKTENSLCRKDESGKRISEPDGKGYLLDCMCGNIIRGRFDPSLPFFTAGGSFWSNSTSALLASTSKEERQSTTRNYCNAYGYESVALIPIKAQSQNLGLVQLNDHRNDMFTPDLIEYLEMIGTQIGLAVRNAALYSKLKKMFEETRTLRGLLPICSFCKRIRDDEGYWHQLESYMAEHSGIQFSHGLCPSCVREHYPEVDIASNSDLDIVIDLSLTKVSEKSSAGASKETNKQRR
ncbi:MAG: GAF domain-containing protein [Deltaproteobacteria bacterium]|nr:GAF domain-containing protein [Deltaproteobacteria bacterium]